jgi:hypothetical protein
MATLSRPTQAWAWPSSLDALVAAPKHHVLLFENEEVRVLDVHIPAGDTVPLHTHCWPSVLYLTHWANFIRRDEHGNTLTDTRRDKPTEAPCTTWAEPYPPHTVENVDSVELHGIAVELKRQKHERPIFSRRKNGAV